MLTEAELDTLSQAQALLWTLSGHASEGSRQAGRTLADKMVTIIARERANRITSPDARRPEHVPTPGAD